MAHLMRTWYKTDATDESVGTYSDTIPDRVFDRAWEIIAVDWSQRGEVEVTYLVPGDGRVSR